MFLDIEQNTDDWHLLRAGKVTGSAISKVMANYGKAFDDPAKRLAVDLAVSQITGRPPERGYSNGAMQRGHEQEPIARMHYEREYFCTVKNGGFYDNGATGCSPDGHVGDNGLIEIKSVIPSVQYKRIKAGTFDPAYKWQLVFNLRETDREWIDYISFCADFPENKKLFVYRAYAESFKKEFEQVNSRLSEYMELVAQVKKEIEAA
jgi:hypothetical protein